MHENPEKRLNKALYALCNKQAVWHHHEFAEFDCNLSVPLHGDKVRQEPADEKENNLSNECPWLLATFRPPF